MFTSFTKKTPVVTIFFASFIFLFSPFFAHAQGGLVVPTLDRANLVVNSDTAYNTTTLNLKENIFDGLALAVAKAAISSLTQSVVNWINSGLEGSPAFVTDLRQHLISIADAEAGKFIDGLLGLDGLLCSPFKVQVQASLRAKYYSQTSSQGYLDNNRCTLTGIQENIEQFVAGDFSQGGWEQFFKLAVEPQNNPYGSYLAAEQELRIRILNAQGEERDILDWASGFLSFQDCLEKDAQGNCTKKGPIKTPGVVIEDQLANTLGTGIRQLELADEFNEIVSALIGQLVTQVLGATGLGGVSSPSYSGGRSYIEMIGGDTGLGGSYGYTKDRVLGVLESAEDVALQYKNVHEATIEAATAAENALNRAIACLEQASTDSQKEPASRQEARNTVTSLNAYLQGFVFGTKNNALQSAARGDSALLLLANLYERTMQIPDTDTADSLIPITDEYQSLLGSGALPGNSDLASARSNEGSRQIELSRIAGEANGAYARCSLLP